MSTTRYPLLVALLVGFSLGTAQGQTNVALNATVSLHGGSFFTGGWGLGLTVDPQTVVDGYFFPQNHQWDQGPVWWDSTDPLDDDQRIEIDLGGLFEIDSFIVQADDNDAYILSYWDMDTNSWEPAWDVPNYDVYNGVDLWGMQTRPDPANNTVKYVLPEPIVTSALKFEGNLLSGDKLFAVSEIQAFGDLIALFVPVDIKPRSCPNPLNVASRGVLTVAILGTEDFDVTTVDPEAVKLAGVPPLRFAFEDVAAPFEPLTGKESSDDCNTEGPDGYMDLTLKFDTQDIVGALGNVEDGDVLAIPLTGETFLGYSIFGEDVVVILKKK